MKLRLLADENTSHRLVAACQQLQPGFPMVHISEWEKGGVSFGQRPSPIDDPAGVWVDTGGF